MDTLHNYSSSGSDDDQQCQSNNFVTSKHPPNTTASRLPSPEALEATNIQQSQSKGDCRLTFSLPPVIRVHDKVDQYLVHVFLPLHHSELVSFARGLMGQARLRMVGSPIKASLTPLTDFHISISRPVIIRSDMIHQLVSQIRNAVSQVPGGQIMLRQNPVAFLSKNTRRLFLAAPMVTSGRENDDIILSLIRLVSRVFQTNGLTPFFDDPKPHMSFAWTETVDINSLFEASSSGNQDQETLILTVERVCCIIGKSQYSFPLAQSHERPQ